MLDKSQAQKVGAEAIAIQAGGNVILNAGLTASEARAIALDVAKSTFFELSGSAKETMRGRVEEITDKVIERLKSETPDGLRQATDPDFQYSLLTVQKQYGRTGDKDLGDLLVDLLVDRSQQQQRSLLQIVLNESLDTAPKLTPSQLAILAIIFAFRYAQNTGAGNFEKFGAFLDKNIQPFTELLTKNEASFQHLEFAGCGSIQMSEVVLEEILGRSYTGLFSKGFEASEIETRSISLGLDQRLFIPCLNDAEKWQVKALNKAVLEERLKSCMIPPAEGDKISALFESSLMNHAEIRSKCESLRPYMKAVFECWSSSSMKQFTLTSVGIAIGHANVKRLAGACGDLSIWIN